MIVKCNKCGDESNSAPNLTCGRVDKPGDEPCTGVYQDIPVPLSDKTFVVTASIYVDGVKNEEEAAAAVAEANEELAESVKGVVGANVEIRLPDPDSGYVWSEVGESKSSLGPGQYSMMLDPKYNRSTPTAPEPTAKQLEIVESFRTNERIVEAGGEVTYEMLPDGVMMLRSTKDVGGRTRISRVPRDGHYGLVRWED